MKCKACKHYTRVGEMCEETLDIIEPGEVECWGYERATNADRIRAMSDEELANFIPDWSHTKACGCNEHEFIGCDNQCEKCVLDWLKHPAEEREDG